MHSDVEKLNALRLEVEDKMQVLQSMAHDVLPRLKRRYYSDPQLCDVGWCFRQMERMFDEMRKEAKAKAELAGKLLAHNRILMSIAAGNDEKLLKIQGELSAATPKVRHEVYPPKRGTPAYERLCRHFGIEDDVAESGVLQFHYQHIGDWATQCAEEGKDLPEGLEPRPVYSCVFRTLKTSNKESDR